MNSASEDIKDIMGQSFMGLPYVFGTNLFIGMMPDKPDLCVSLYDTGGYDPDVSNEYFNPTIQIMLRGGVGHYKATYEGLQEIRNFLHRIHNEIYNSTRYLLITGQGDILYIGVDDRNRPIFSTNFRIQRTES